VCLCEQWRHTMNDSSTPQSAGGKARALALTSEERSRIAREGAIAKRDMPVAEFGSPDKPIRIADIEVPCYVLKDGRRVISMKGMLETLNLPAGGSKVSGVNRLELFSSGKLIKPFISNDLLERSRNPIKFRIGPNTAYGFTSDTLIEIAEAVVKAFDAGVLQPQQTRIAKQCKVIISSLTRVGLIALIDEATGYQTRRSSDELQQILEKYILPEHRPWMTAVPEEFMDEMYRVYGWKRQEFNRGPRYAGKLIKELIYERLPEQVLPKLEELNPLNKNKQRKFKHHQFLTNELGLTHFRTQVITIMTLLRISKDKLEFKKHIKALFGSQTAEIIDSDDNLM
jgi:hypothetical protein